MNKTAAALAGFALLAGVAGHPLFGRGVEKPLADYGFEGLKTTTTLDLRGIDVVEAIKFLANKGALNIIASKEVAGSVHLLMDSVSVGDALETVLAANRLAYMVKGNIIQVMSENEYRALTGVNFYDDRVMKVYQLANASAKDVATMLQPIKSERGEIVYDDAAGTLIIRDISAKLSDMEQVIGIVDKEGEKLVTEKFVLQYGKIEEVQAEVAKTLSPDRGMMRTDKRTKTLIVTDTAEKIAEIKEIVASFDTRTKSVYIEARIVSVSLTDQFQFGIDWGAISKWTLPVEVVAEGVYLNDLFHRGDYSTDPMGNQEVPARMKTYGALNQDLIFDILDTFGDTELISDPRITVENGKEATLQVVTSEAYEAGSSEVDSGGVTTSYTNFEFIDVGVTLSVLPEINDEGFISLRIKPEISNISDWYGGENGSAAPRSAGSVPIVRRSTAETTVTVKDGVTVMIAGLIDEAKSENVSKVPFLGDIYGIGKLFRHTSESSVRRETIIFLTPHIVYGDETVESGGYSSPTLPKGDKQLKGLRD